MYKNISEVTIESLRKHVTKIHYFGLGFIQIKLGDVYRIHFYNKSLPAIVGDEDVHNHRYGFNARVLYGNFTQEIFQVLDGDTHLIEDESCSEEFVLTSSPRLCSVEKIMQLELVSGSTYGISHSVFHKVITTDAITVLTRCKIVKEFAQVVRLVGSPKICPFSKKVSESDLWDIVQDMLTNTRK